MKERQQVRKGKGNVRSAISQMLPPHLELTKPKRTSFVRLKKQYGKQVSALLERTVAAVSHRQTLGIVNLVSTVVLLLQWFSVIRRLGTAGALSGSSNLYLDQLPYPVDIAVQSRSRLQPRAADLKVHKFAGYAEVRPGTFRSRYPSTKLSDVFDEVLVITNPKCPSQWETFQVHAAHAGLSVKPLPVTSFRQISLASPPLPIAKGAGVDERKGSKQAVALLKRHISYLDAHRQIWQHIVSTRKQRVLILDDSIFPSRRLRELVAPLFNNVDQESIAGQTPWHLVTFRRKAANWSNSSREVHEPAWSANPHYNHAVVRSRPSYGSGMYALSTAGAIWMLDHVREYRVPMDVEIALLQREYVQDFVVLSACNNDEPRDFCPDLSDDITLARTKHSFECSWRRLHERILSDQSDKLNRS
jgi:hypothetical protein